MADGEGSAAGSDIQGKERHWKKSRNLTFCILFFWFIFGYVVPWHAKGLNEFSFLGFPLGYYFIVQGSLLIFVILIFVQNWFQDKIDAELGMTEETEEESK